MITFLKTFGKGILYFIGLPFLLLFLCLYGAYLLVIFFIVSIKSVILFFAGKNISIKDELDDKAFKILKAKGESRVNSYQNNYQQDVKPTTINNTYNNLNIVPPIDSNILNSSNLIDNKLSNSDDVIDAKPNKEENNNEENK